jgi:N-acetylglucosaminyl-diphospho-decaprenol L-rhamnosyltransferase
VTRKSPEIVQETANFAIQARVVVAIVSWNTLEMTHRCLRSLEPEVTAATAGEYGVIVVDNASDDGTAAMVRQEFPWARLIENGSNAGFARANNQAIAASRGEFILLLNSDTEVLPGAIGALTEFMDDHPQAGAAAARLLDAGGRLQPSCHPMLTPEREFWRLIYLDRLLPRASYRMGSWDERAPRLVEVMMGACMMLRRTALDQVGPLDERYFMYTEEVDLCHRLSQGGWQLWYVPAARVTHYGQASSRQVPREMFLQLYRSKVQFYRKVGGEALASKFKDRVRMAYLPRRALATLLSPFSQEIAGRRARYDALLDQLGDM